jgi:hypothetical protein
MSVAPALILYSRTGCHLCDQAAALLEREGIAFEEVNIEAEPALDRMYGLRIPVLRDPGSGRELDYPFNAEAVFRLCGKAL